MAQATHERPEIPPTFILTLDENEALYVLGTLGASSQRVFGPDTDRTVYDVLFAAMERAGINPLYDPRAERAYNGAQYGDDFEGAQ